MAEAPCIYFGTCGGCTYQDLEYEAQLELKRKWVQDALDGIDHFDVSKVPPTIPSPKSFHYRNMLSLTVKRCHGALALGFMANDSRSFIPIGSCSIADERIDRFLPEALRKLETLPPKKRYHTSQIALRVGGQGEVVTSLRPDRGRTLECTVFEKQFSYSVSSFFQNNFSILESFIETVRDFLNPAQAGTLVDLYSGVGLLGISLVAGYERVIGIEEGHEAVWHAKQNAERNGLRNAEFLQGKVETLLPKLISGLRKPLHMIIDPPRIGLKLEVVETLMKMLPERLVYVSCSLESLRRDLSRLKERFNIARVQPLDFFPQTKHIETLALLLPLNG